MNTKTCKTCKVDFPKTSEFFHYNDKIKGYFKSYCKECDNTRVKKRYQENREHALKRNRERYQENREHILKRRREHYQENREQILERQKRYNSSPEVIKRRNERLRERRKSDPTYKIRMNVSRDIRRALLKSDRVKDNNTWSALPYSPQQLEAHLEGQFEDWMTWDNYGNTEGCWNIDHIQPQSKLPYDSLEHPNFQKCWALKNLRPLCSIKNSSKGNR